MGIVLQSVLPSLNWKLLSMAIQHLWSSFSCNLIQSCPLRQPANVSSVFLWPKSCEVVCKFWEKFVPHTIQTIHCHFILSCVDVINALQNVEWVPVILDSFVWPVQNCHHFCESLAEVMGLKAYYYPLVHWLQKWCHFLMVYKQHWHPELFWLSKVCSTARGIAQEKKSLGW